MKLKLLFLLGVFCNALMAQQLPRAIQYFRSDMQFFRPYDQSALYMFETNKVDTIPFTGINLRLGGSFTLNFQGLSHRNNADFVPSSQDPNLNANKLVGLTNAFNVPMANLNLDVQLADGMRASLTLYLSSREHPATRIKNGYLQIDKLSYLKSALIDSIMTRLTMRMGILEVDYGDAHYRRSDGGNSMHNPFVENYIMDQFTTEIGSEFYYRSKIGFLAMLGLSNGQQNPTVLAPTNIDSATGKVNVIAPAFHAKVGYDKQLTPDFRVRLTGSVYTVSSMDNNTLYYGDRAGSHYFYVIENGYGNSYSGRYNPRFNQQVNAFMINPFIKYKGFEFFGLFELAEGRTVTEKSMRKVTQYAADVLYRFPAKLETYWIGARYNSVTATNHLNASDITINRIVATAGTFVTKNVMMKLEYVNQEYQNFQPTDIRSDAKFSGLVFSTVLAF